MLCSCVCQVAWLQSCWHWWACLFQVPVRGMHRCACCLLLAQQAQALAWCHPAGTSLWCGFVDRMPSFVAALQPVPSLNCCSYADCVPPSVLTYSKLPSLQLPQLRGVCARRAHVLCIPQRHVPQCGGTVVPRLPAGQAARAARCGMGWLGAGRGRRALPLGGLRFEHSGVLARLPGEGMGKGGTTKQLCLTCEPL